MGMKFTVNTYEKLFKLVQENPCIYDSALSEYRDSEVQQNVWCYIATEMGDATMTWDDWRKFWRQKRDHYTRKRKLVKLDPHGSVAKKIRKNSLYEQMSFLDGPQESSDSVNFPPALSVDLDDECEMGNYQENSEQQKSTFSLTSTNNTEHGVRTSPRCLFSDAPSTSTPATRHMHSKAGEALPNQEESSESNKERKMIGKHVTGVDQLLIQLNEHTKENTDTLNTIAKCTCIMAEPVRKDEGIFSFLSSKIAEFSKSTQDWLEDEVLKLYLEARQREKRIQEAVTSTGATPGYSFLGDGLPNETQIKKDMSS